MHNRLSFGTILALVAVALFCLAQPAVGQDDTRPPRKWTLLLSGGPMLGGPSGAYEDLLREHGYAEGPCWILCDLGDVGDGGEWELAIGYQVRERWQLRAGYSGSSGETASGSRGPRALREHEGKDWSRRTVTVAMGYLPSRNTRLVAGPTLSWIGSGELTPNVVRPGLMLEAGVSTSSYRRIYLDFAATLRLMAGYTAHPRFSEPIDLPLTYGTIRMGLGVRL